VNNKSKGENCGHTTFISHEVDEDGNFVLDEDDNPIFRHQLINLCAEVFIDTNGARGPNQLGKDVFHFLFYSDKFFPHPDTPIYGDPKKILQTGIIE